VAWVHKDTLLDELRRVERDVVQGERQLAEQEALLVSLKLQNHDVSEAQALLEMMRENQRRRDQDRLRLLSLLQP
jgi:anthranilate phosphoribosyltransferase